MGKRFERSRVRCFDVWGKTLVGDADILATTIASGESLMTDKKLPPMSILRTTRMTNVNCTQNEITE